MAVRRGEQLVAEGGAKGRVGDVTAAAAGGRVIVIVAFR